MVSFEYFKTCPHPVAHWQVEAEEEEISCLENQLQFFLLSSRPRFATVLAHSEFTQFMLRHDVQK